MGVTAKGPTGWIGLELSDSNKAREGQGVEHMCQRVAIIPSVEFDLIRRKTGYEGWQGGRMHNLKAQVQPKNGEVWMALEGSILLCGEAGMAMIEDTKAQSSTEQDKIHGQSRSNTEAQNTSQNFYRNISLKD